MMENEPPLKLQGSNRRMLRWLLCANILLLSLSIFALSMSLSLNFGFFTPRNWALRHTSSHSPLLLDFEIPIIKKKHNITLLLPENPSIYRQEPSDEVDLAWQRIGDLRLFPLTLEDVLAIGKNPEDIVKFPPNFGLGEETYAGRVDVFHQLHCLDALRREAYFEHYYSQNYPRGWNETTEMHRLHLSHCIEYLLESILCQASTDVDTHIWTDGVEHPFPDFRNERKCRDYSAIKKWHNRNAVNVENFVALRAPEGAKVHRVTRKFKEIHGWFAMHEDDGENGTEVV
ncbi:hypothetical protein QBC35DRAFT_547483 [Podospora australis]|uniref:Uncharacterized protein n=1 Tax=Podospora australis TaxID=1536484 RepID=A0AAN6WJD6_9PEZI|nr:hypothetical protein QBC35DRAFT_547483 [Podospora australis]